MVKIFQHLKNAWKWYDSRLHQRPLMVKTAQGLVISCVGDCLAQTYARNAKRSEQVTEEPDLNAVHAEGLFDTGTRGTCAIATTEPYDWRRTASIGTFAVVWGAPFGHFWYNLIERAVPGKGWPVVAKKIVFDQIMGPPGLLLFFLAVGTMEGHSFEEVKDSIRRNFWPTQIAGWKLWPCVNVVTFGLVPLHFRPLFCGVISLGWSVYSSWSVHCGTEPVHSSHAGIPRAEIHTRQLASADNLWEENTKQ